MVALLGRGFCLELVICLLDFAVGHRVCLDVLLDQAIGQGHGFGILQFGLNNSILVQSLLDGSLAQNFCGDQLLTNHISHFRVSRLSLRLCLRTHHLHDNVDAFWRNGGAVNLNVCCQHTARSHQAGHYASDQRFFHVFSVPFCRNY